MATEIKPETLGAAKEVINLTSHEEENEDDINEMEHLRKLFIGGLSPQTTEDGLKQFYGQWGRIVDAVVMRDPITKRSRGFGFITYIKSASVDKAQDNRPHVIDGKTVDSKRALPRPEREKKEVNLSVKKVFVGGLKDNHDEKSLEDYFSQFGHVVSVKLLVDRTTGKKRGFAFVEFDDYDSVDKAVLQKVHTIKYAIIDVKKSVYTQEKQKYYEKQYESGAQQATYGPPRHQQPGAYKPGAGGSQYQQPQYNYWGTAPQYPAPQQYGAYAQQPVNGRNPPSSWNSGWSSAGSAQPPPPSNNWYTNQWPASSAPPQSVPRAASGPAPQAAWNAPAAVGPQQTGPPAANFGTGYQQSYGGGPSKPNAANSSRVHPYGPPQNSASGHANTPVAAPGYNGYGSHKPPTAHPVNVAAQMANKFRR